MRVERHESETADWELARRDPPPEASLVPPPLHGRLAADSRSCDGAARGSVSWDPADLQPRPSLGDRSTRNRVVRRRSRNSAVHRARRSHLGVLRASPDAARRAHRLLGVPMSELTNQAIEPWRTLRTGGAEARGTTCVTRPAGRRDSISWDAFLLRRLADSARGASGNRVVVAPPLRHARSGVHRRHGDGARLEPSPPHLTLP